MPRILVVYYSRTGRTRLVAREIAAALGADLEEIVDPTPRSGVFGYLRSSHQAFFRGLPPIADAIHHPADYDLVVIGTPIWNASLSAPVRSYLRRHHAAMRNVAFFLTCGGFGIDRVFRQMAEESSRRPVARLAVRERELGTAVMSRGIGRFCAEVRAAVTPEPAAQPA
jgi:flavodoxin